MPDEMQCPAEVAKERIQLRHENKILREKLTATRTALEAADDFLHHPKPKSAAYIQDEAKLSRLIKHTLAMTT